MLDAAYDYVIERGLTELSLRPLAEAIGSDVKGYASLVIYAAGVGLAFVSPWIAYALYVAVALVWFVPDRRFVRVGPPNVGRL